MERQVTVQEELRDASLSATGRRAGLSSSSSLPSPPQARESFLFPLSTHSHTHPPSLPSAQVWESVPQSRRRRRRRPSNEAPSSFASASVRVECERTLSPLFPLPLLHSSVRLFNSRSKESVQERTPEQKHTPYTV